MALTHSSFRVLSVFITDLLKERGFTPAKATIALMVFNFSGIPGCLSLGLVKKLTMGSSLCCVTFVTFLASPSALALNFVTGLTIAVVCCAAIGLAFGAVTAANAVSVAGLVGEACYAPGVGLSYGLTGIIVADTGPLSELLWLGDLRLQRKQRFRATDQLDGIYTSEIGVILIDGRTQGQTVERPHFTTYMWRGSLIDSSSSYLMALTILAAAVLLGFTMFFLHRLC